VSRSAVYEHTVLRESLSRAERRWAIDTNSFGERVLARLDQGAREYGDNAFMAKDVMRELREEAWDAAAYALLEAQKLIALDDDDLDARMVHLAEIIELAAALDWHARQAGAQ
jgi:hypothetical protein